MDKFNLPEFVENILQRHKDKQVNAITIWKGIGRSLNVGKFFENLSEAFKLPVDKIESDLENRDIDAQVIWRAIKNSLIIEKLIENLSEAFPLPVDSIQDDLKDLGFLDIVLKYQLKNHKKKSEDGEQSQSHTYDELDELNPFQDIFRVSAQHGFVDCVPNDGKEGFLHGLKNDPLRNLYRENVLDYFENFMKSDALKINEYIEEYFSSGYPKYLVTTGIGANEQFNHYIASINNNDKDRRLTWIIINSPKRLSLLPDDANLNNTLFMEFSRSSLTEETVKIHEYTSRKARRIVFSNSGPLRELGERDNKYILNLRLPDTVSGRYGRNKTPILLAPMYVAGMNVEEYWHYIENAINAFDVCNLNSLPVVIAEYLFQHQKAENRNFIYLGCNDDTFILLADEFVQYWNEGVNKDGNDLLVSRFFGLPRDSHMNAEGILGNKDSKMAIFLLRTNMKIETSHPLVSNIIDPVNKEHEGLHFGDEEAILAFANYRRFAEVMPTILLEIPNEPSLKHSAVIGQLFADITFVYAHRIRTNPGSNPEVKAVRERSASLLSEAAEKIRNGQTIRKAIAIL